MEFTLQHSHHGDLEELQHYREALRQVRETLTQIEALQTHLESERFDLGNITPVASVCTWRHKRAHKRVDEVHEHLRGLSHHLERELCWYELKCPTHVDGHGEPRFSEKEVK
mgnify:FL=1